MTTTWIRAAAISDLEAAGGLLGCTVSGLPIALYAVDGAFFATLNVCTHGQARLSDGWLDGYLIECPLHQGLFDVRTGEPKGAPCTKAVQSFPVREEGGELLVGV